jgi:tetratricopeptide (TPR) repeat protein
LEGEARKFSEKVIGEQDDSAVGYLLLARLNNLQGHYDKAIYESRRALKRFPDCQCAHYERGIAYLSQGRYQAAVKSLKQALELNPSDGETLYGLGYAYLRSGSPAEAVAFLKAAGELRPELTEVWKALGEACSRTNRKDEALEAYRQAICADPGNQNSYYRLAAELMRQGSHDEAINILGQGLESCGPSAWLTYHLGKAYCWAGQLDEARQQAKKLSRQNPSLAKLLANYIEASNGS